MNLIILCIAIFQNIFITLSLKLRSFFILGLPISSLHLSVILNEVKNLKLCGNNDLWDSSLSCQWHLYFYCHAINLLIVWLKKRCFWILNSVIITTCEIPHFVYQWHLYFCRSFWTKWRIQRVVVKKIFWILRCASEWQG